MTTKFSHSYLGILNGNKFSQLNARKNPAEGSIPYYSTSFGLTTLRKLEILRYMIINEIFY